MTQFLNTYNEWLGMTPAGVITTICGAFVFAFVVSICWGRLVKDFGPLGGLMASGVIVGSIWVLNHALPGVGSGALMPSGTEPGAFNWITAQFAKDAAGNPIQTGLVFQSYHFGGPWIDMGWAAAVGLWVGSLYAGASARKSLPSLLAAIIGGALGGIIVGLVSYNHHF